ncbi:MAG: hypothetical protein K5854_08905 [Prevotella sp.]|nr:hypothetical protein [Prevotella sp.]
MEFTSKEAFSNEIENFNIANASAITRACPNFESAEDASNENIGFLIPNDKYRHFLNKNLEIIVGDSIYKVTSSGTLCTAIKYKNELEYSCNDIKNFKRINQNTKEYGHIKLINTFDNWDSKETSPLNDASYFDNDSNDVVINNKSATRATNQHELTREDVEQFPVIGTVRVSILDKILHMSPRYMKYAKLRFSSNSHRKLYVSVYRYDYGFGVSIGIDCKVMKKLWHGMSWGHMERWDDGIYYGLSSLVIRQSIKQPIFEDFMKNGKDLLKKQWQSINNCNFTTYADATKNFSGGIQNQWTTEYNGIPSTNKYNIPIIGERIEDLLGGNKQSTQIAKSFDNFLVKKGIHFCSTLGNKNAGKEIQFFSENDQSIYSFYNNDLTWNGGGYRIKETFMKYYRNIVFNVSFNLGNGNPSAKFKGINISDNDIVGAPEIFFCEGLVYTRDGDGWIGVRILQDESNGVFRNSDGSFGNGHSYNNTGNKPNPNNDPNKNNNGGHFSGGGHLGGRA